MAENTNTNLPKTTEEARAKQASQPAQQSPQAQGPLQTDHGTTTIAETVVQKLAGIAAREVPGVYAMGAAGRRALNAISERIPGSQTNVSGGVSVEKGDLQTAIDVSIVVEYGVSIAEVAEDIRRSIIQAVEHGTSLEVIEVNVNVTDVHLPEEDNDDAVSDRSDRLE
ncbi:Asp23/Gls24 family envelope stress response protein [Arthrobacter rhombi]|uniref:Alkaline shock protein 23 n=1 Tax=Arthrobacter rhombi TaxID=71253 RepID=A0A1R4FXN1_9MICC|nr:Asp23/Gls24 family envelope stress response protein [Arthrobacter rhombi]SJM60472.1 Alkaline shock protein 23 [Arthrobacter rhombi]